MRNTNEQALACLKMTDSVSKTAHSIYIVESKIQKVRLKYMKRVAKDKGFSIAENLCDHVVYIVSELESRNKVEEVLKRHSSNFDHERLGRMEMVSVEWFTACMEAGHLVTVEDHHRLRTSAKIVPIKAESESTKEKDDYVNARYCCQRVTPLNHHNHRFTDALEVLEKHAEFLGGDNNLSRALAFHKASAALKAYPRPVRGMQEVENLNDLKGGTHCKRVIQDILEDGFSSEVDKILADEWFITLKIFTGVFGCGPATAKKWFDKGLRSLEDVRQAQDLQFSYEQKKGLEHYEDLNTPVTKIEAEQIMNTVKKVVEGILEGATVTMTGDLSDKAAGHDVDFLISHPVEGKEIGLLNKILHNLRPYLLYTDIQVNTYTEGGAPQIQYKKNTLDHFERCFSIFRLDKESTEVSTPSGYDLSHQSKRFKLDMNQSESSKDWKAVRVDFVITPNSQYAYALMGWTGSRMFCRSMRDYANKEMGMTLTSHGLFSKSDYKSLEAKTEMEIFDHLKLPYREPHERNC